MIRKFASHGSEEIMTILKRCQEIIECLYLLAAYLCQFRHIISKLGSILYSHGLIWSPSWQHLNLETTLTDGLMVFQRINGIVRGTNHLHTIAAHESTGRKLWKLQLRVALIVYLTSRIRIQQLVDSKGSAKLQVCPVIQRISQGIWHRLCPFLELLPIGSISSDEMFCHPISTHGTPFIMVATQPQFCDRAELIILCYHLRIQMTVIVYDRQFLSMLMIEHLCRLRLQQEVGIHEVFHIN